MTRRKSVDSSSSSSSDSSDPHKKRKERKEEVKERREEKKKERDERKEERRREREHKKHSKNDMPVHSGPCFPSSSGDAYTHHQIPQGAQSHLGGGHRAGGDQLAPPPYVPQNPVPPPSGYRIPLTTQTGLPPDTGPPAFVDADGVSPIFIGSALMERSVHPCKIGPHLNPVACVPYGGVEYGHHGRFDLLPFRQDQMEWVRTSRGRIPSGRKPIEGGYEEDGNKLYHAVAVVNGVRVPGKAGEHLSGARIPFGGAEHEIYDYEILCWRW